MNRHRDSWKIFPRKEGREGGREERAESFDGREKIKKSGCWFFGGEVPLDPTRKRQSRWFIDLSVPIRFAMVMVIRTCLSKSTLCMCMCVCVCVCAQWNSVYAREILVNWIPTEIIYLNNCLFHLGCTRSVFVLWNRTTDPCVQCISGVSISYRVVAHLNWIINI